MVAAPPEEPISTTAVLSFSQPPADGSAAYYNISADSRIGESQQNSTVVSHEVTVYNARTVEEKPTLDTHGFQLVKQPAKHTSFNDDKEIEREYYEESIQALKDVTGASRVVIFDHTIRRRRPGESGVSPQKRQPAASVHVDQTTKASIARVHRHLPASEAPELLKKRFQIINLWRPINHPADDWPLGLCDYRTVDKDDTYPVALVYPKELREPGEIMAVNWSEGQKWWYWRGVKPEEFILIKCFDSIQDGSVAVFTPHTGFEDPNTPTGAPYRESIELRALVFYDE